jgi:hypothetical protein
MKLNGIVQNIIDTSYESQKSKGHVDQREVHVVEIGADAYAGSIAFRMPADKVKVAIGDPCQAVITGATAWAGGVQFRGSVSPQPKVK